MRIEATSLLRRNPRVEYRSLADGEGGVLLHLTTGAYHGVNEVGALTWSLLDGLTLPELLKVLHAKFDDVPPTFTGDIEEFVQALVDRDLIVQSLPDSP